MSNAIKNDTRYDELRAFNKEESPEVNLRNAIAADILEFGDLAEQRRSAAFWLRIVAAAFGAATTVLIGAQGFEIFKSYKETLSVAALVLSALVTVVNAGEAFFDFRWDWVRFKATYAKLYGLLYRLNFENAKSESVESKKLDEISQEHIDAIVGVNVQWVAHQTNPTEQPPP
ncbi:MAG TPA: DUF4231 domain-containing protein [Methylocella sp.]